MFCSSEEKNYPEKFSQLSGLLWSFYFFPGLVILTSLNLAKVKQSEFLTKLGGRNIQVSCRDLDCGMKGESLRKCYTTWTWTWNLLRRWSSSLTATRALQGEQLSCFITSGQARAREGLHYWPATQNYTDQTLLMKSFIQFSSVKVWTLHSRMTYRVG